jgi:hypothetical protein
VVRDYRFWVAVLALQLAAGCALGVAVVDAPLEPGRLAGLVRADALSALVVIVAAGHGLVGLALGARAPWRLAVAAGLVGVATLAGHLGIAGALLVGAAVAGGRQEGGRLPWLAAACVALGLALVGLLGGEWRYGAPAAGRGLNSFTLLLVLAGALLAAGVADLAQGRAPAADPFVALGALSCLLRLFSLGPWNLGWLFAALLVGGAAALWAAWAAAAAPAGEVAPWLGLYLAGLVITGAGLASGAGVTLAGYALLLGPALRLGLADAAPARPLWLLSAAMPLSAPFVAAWMGVAAAVAGGVTAVAATIWAAALLAALPAAKLGAASPAGRPPARVLAAAALSAALGLGAPLVVEALLAPVAAQLQGGLTPFGEIELWPWAGLIAFDAARQPVATLPSVALAGLMVILSALCWVALRVGRMQQKGEG